ncbi:uncharacterized protein LOC116218678 [Clupea harengus]|uniref:Uncharacterized protein LOC116218678 n=1 Tax=Clupea harengus TaxID=7950 RepID=A0A6P8EX95_CLUHA|nr:uncharacterized protein LOC116218678 [Clupea harengus]
MDTKPLMMMVHLGTVKDIVSRLLLHLLPMGLKDFNLADCSLFDTIFSELSSSLFLSVSRNKRKATVCLDSVEVCQVVLMVYKQLIKMYGSPEHLESLTFAKCPEFYSCISKLIVEGILKSPPRQPSGMKETRAVCSSNVTVSTDVPRTPKEQTECGKKQQTKMMATIQAEAIECHTNEYSSTITEGFVLGSSMGKDKIPKKKGRVGRFFHRIFKGVRRSFTSCTSSRGVMD